MSGNRGRRGERAIAAAQAPAVTRRHLWLLAGILLLTAAVYSRSLSNGFISFDDPDVVVDNPYIRQLGAANLVRWFTAPVQYMYMPLALVSYTLDYRLGGLDPRVYHLHNLVLHLGWCSSSTGSSVSSPATRGSRCSSPWRSPSTR